MTAPDTSGKKKRARINLPSYYNPGLYIITAMQPITKFYGYVYQVALTDRRLI
ncbi:hypothetical protein [Methanolobus halotolerans]|uniref:hypothetical protein n=1 Tax=Methanolobus halotolerans TaxID=2052935 RepID=UPI00143691DA|nr:hypothetical protein [Methanolobus halotolerans]